MVYSKFAAYELYLMMYGKSNTVNNLSQKKMRILYEKNPNRNGTNQMFHRIKQLLRTYNYLLKGFEERALLERKTTDEFVDLHYLLKGEYYTTKQFLSFYMKEDVL